MNKFLMFFFISWMFRFAHAQEFLGTRNSNYAGIQSAFLNPAFIADAKTKWDVNLGSMGVFFDNDFFYIPRQQVPTFGFKKLENGIKNNTIVSTRFDPHNPNEHYQMVSSAEVIGPSFYMPLNQKEQIGFTLAVRGYANIQQVTGHLAQNVYKDLKDPGLWDTQWQDHSAKLNSMSWVEYGLHYGRVLYHDATKELKMGISLKYLQGITAAYTKNTNLNYAVIDSNNVMLTHSSMDYGGTTDFPDKKLRNLTHGNGVSESIGLTYVYLRDPSSCNYKNATNAENEFGTDYTYKVGISLIDFGHIKYNKNSGSYYVQADSAVYSGISSTNSSPNTGSNSINAIFYENDSIKHLTANSFNMALPSAISIQADWHVHNQFYLNATIIKGFGHGSHPGIVRPDIYSITPRYENSWFEVSLPVSILYYQRWQPRIGFAFRIGYFFFGADAPGGLLGLADLARADLYAGIHFFPLERNHKSKSLLCPSVRN